MADETPVLRLTEQDDALIVGFDRHELYDGPTVEALERELSALWATDQSGLWVFDFTGVKIVVSQVIGLVLRSYQRCRARDGQARLCGLDDDVRRVFEMMGMHQLFRINDTVAEALQADNAP